MTLLSNARQSRSLGGSFRQIRKESFHHAPSPLEHVRSTRRVVHGRHRDKCRVDSQETPLPRPSHRRTGVQCHDRLMPWLDLDPTARAAPRSWKASSATTSHRTERTAGLWDGRIPARFAGIASVASNRHRITPGRPERREQRPSKHWLCVRLSADSTPAPDPARPRLDPGSTPAPSPAGPRRRPRLVIVHGGDGSRDGDA
jgi:hypothetical protein